jgi:ankyrin repeat protein
VLFVSQVKYFQDPELARVKDLVAAGASIEGRNPDTGMTSLMHAADNNDIKLFRLLISLGADLHATNGLNDLVRYTHRNSISIEVAKLLNRPDAIIRHIGLYDESTDEERAALTAIFDKGGDVNFRLRNGKTLLIHALYEVDWPLAELLVQKGADINHPYMNGLTFLMYALESGYSEFAELLIQKGADIRAVNGDRDVASYARRDMAIRIATMLNRPDVIIKHVDVFDPSTNEECAALNAIFDKGGDVNSRLSNGMTLLMHARNERDAALAELLIQRGAR